MRILVCGSSVLDPQHYELARTVGRTIIADTPHTLMFGGFKADAPGLSVDQLVAEGALGELRQRGQRADRRVVTVVPEDDRWNRIYVGQTRIVRESDSAARRTVMVGAADLIISVGGKFGTSAILTEAHRLRKPFLPLAFSGDASANVWAYDKRLIIDALRLDGDDIAFVENGVQPWKQHLIRIIGRVSGSVVQRLRLLVVSPGDVAPERDLVQQAVEELNEGIAHVLSLQIEVGRWETDAFPGFHVDGAQGVVDEVLKIDAADIVVGIFWSRIGTPVHDARGGAEHELRQAIAAYREHRRPHVMLYFSSRPYAPADAQQEQQRANVLSLHDELNDSALLGRYEHPPDFERTLRHDLTRYLRTRYFA